MLGPPTFPPCVFETHSLVVEAEALNANMKDKKKKKKKKGRDHEEGEGCNSSSFLTLKYSGSFYRLTNNQIQKKQIK